MKGSEETKTANTRRCVRRSELATQWVSVDKDTRPAVCVYEREREREGGEQSMPLANFRHKAGGM